MYELTEQDLVRHCAPTLAGLKTGSLFCCPYRRREQVHTAVRALNGTLVKKGLRLIPLRCMAGRALLYLYRPKRLGRDLERPEARALLRRAGYCDLRHERCVGELIRRLRRAESFPHEIGLFLSYPPEDVRGFIEHGGKDWKCCGCWKVYGDAVRAERLFDTYRKCTECYLKQRSMGVSLDRLAVAE